MLKGKSNVVNSGEIGKHIMQVFLGFFPFLLAILGTVHMTLSFFCPSFQLQKHESNNIV